MGAAVNLLGQRFGQLIVIAKAPNYKRKTCWLCKCDCGNEVIKTTSNLRSGHAKSCGCSYYEKANCKGINPVGQRFGRLIVTKLYGVKNHKRIWECKCDCGGTAHLPTSSLKVTKSCGCLQIESTKKTNLKHGYSSRHGSNHIKHIYKGMIDRCENPRNPQYKNYGARGIKVCSSWHDLKAFGDWATTHGCKDNLQIDRIDNDGDYCPENCRFVTPIENANNRRKTVYVTIEGQRLPLSEAARKYNCPRWRIVNRLRAGRKDIELISVHVKRKEANTNGNSK